MIVRIEIVMCAKKIYLKKLTKRLNCLFNKKIKALEIIIFRLGARKTCLLAENPTPLWSPLISCQGLLFYYKNLIN